MSLEKAFLLEGMGAGDFFATASVVLVIFAVLVALLVLALVVLLLVSVSASVLLSLLLLKTDGPRGLTQGGSAPGS